ncbi:MAG: phage portal protein [Methylobacter sp.]
MRLIEKVIASFSPQAALRRAQARHLLRAYEAAVPGKLRKQARDRRTPSAVVRSAAVALRDQARNLDENHDIAKGVINTLVCNIVGKGIQIEPLVKQSDGKLHEEANKLLADLWRDWCFSPEVTDELNWSSVERLACRSWLRDGEVFVKMLFGERADLNHVSKVPFSIEMIESDYVPFGIGYPVGDAIDGIVRDDWGRAKTFHMAKRNNADIIPGFTFVPVDAQDVVHLKNIDRLRQGRGITILASVLTRLEDIKDYEESERIAAKIAASMAAYIKKGTPDMYESAADGSARSLRFSPGMVFDDLMPGEEIGMIDSNRPNPNLETFRQGQLKAVAAGTSTGYSSISRSYDGSYSAQRQEMVETSVLYAALRDHFIERFSRPIWRRFVQAARAASLIKLSGIDWDTIENADFRGPGLPWIDPAKEVKAELAAVQAGFKSKTQVIRERGTNPQDVRDQIASEREKDNELNLKFNSDYANEISQSNNQSSDQTAG